MILSDKPPQYIGKIRSDSRFVTIRGRKIDTDELQNQSIGLAYIRTEIWLAILLSAHSQLEAGTPLYYEMKRLIEVKRLQGECWLDALELNWRVAEAEPTDKLAWHKIKKVRKRLEDATLDWDNDPDADLYRKNIGEIYNEAQGVKLSTMDLFEQSMSDLEKYSRER